MQLQQQVINNLYQFLPIIYIKILSSYVFLYVYTCTPFINQYLFDNILGYLFQSFFQATKVKVVCLDLHVSMKTAKVYINIHFYYRKVFDKPTRQIILTTGFSTSQKQYQIKENLSQEYLIQRDYRNVRLMRVFLNSWIKIKDNISRISFTLQKGVTSFPKSMQPQLEAAINQIFQTIQKKCKFLVQLNVYQVPSIQKLFSNNSYHFLLRLWLHQVGTREEVIYVLSSYPFSFLKELYFSNLTLKNKGVKSLIKRDWKSLQKLRLEYCSITSDGLKYLSKYSYPKLQDLILTETEVTRDALKIIIQLKQLINSIWLQSKWPAFVLWDMYFAEIVKAPKVRVSIQKQQMFKLIIQTFQLYSQVHLKQ